MKRTLGFLLIGLAAVFLIACTSSRKSSDEAELKED